MMFSLFHVPYIYCTNDCDPEAQVSQSSHPNVGVWASVRWSPLGMGNGPAPQQSQKAVPGTAACLTHSGVVCVFNTAQLQMAHGSDTSTGAQNTVATRTLSNT